MNVPYYTLAIDITIKGARNDQDVTLRLLKLVPFVPATGMTLELWHDGGEDGEDATHRIELVNVCYSFKESMFVEEQEDHDLVEAHRDGTFRASDLRDVVDWYIKFGFLRLNYPTVQVANNTFITGR